MTAHEHDRARQLVLEHGWNATSWQILNPGFRLWFNASETGVVGYVEYHGVRVVAGVPVCAADDLDSVAGEFEGDATSAGRDVAYFGVEARAATLWNARADRIAIVVGAQPVWRPGMLAEAMRTHASLRAQLNRATNKGVTVEQWDCDRAERSSDLRRSLDEWLKRRGLPPLHFLVEPDTLPSLRDRRIFVALRSSRVAGFLIASPIPARNGWLIEQNVRAPSAPNGTTESLLQAAAQWMHEQHAAMVTLGLSPLSRHAPRSDEQPSRAIRALFAWLRIHGGRFYNFAGLDAFKAKFRPESWEPVYAVVPRDHSWRALIAIGAAFGGAPAPAFAARVARHALSNELRRLRM